MRRTGTLDMTQGAVAKKLLTFMIPVLITNVIQHLYTVADRVVVGQFAENGTAALAAVGSTASITGMFLNLFYGMSMGSNVTCANYRGAREYEKLSQSMHSAILLAAVAGLAMSAAGVFLSGPILELMNTPESYLDLAALYLKIFFLGVPGSLVYNFGGSILRSHGDTKRPMYILSVTGLVNVALNLVLVIVFKLGVAGVAIATITAQYLSAIAVVVILFSPKGDYKMQFRKLRFHKEPMFRIVRIGIPGGLNSMVFTLSNTVILTSVNSFDSAVISAAKTAANDINALIYQVIIAIYSACVSFTGQCFGAKKYKRIDELARKATVIGSGILMGLAIVITLLRRQLLGLFNSDRAVINAGIPILMINCWFYALYLWSEVPLGCLRGMRQSMLPSVLNVIGICLPRVLWTIFVFPFNRTLWFLYLCYPISWAISAVLQWMYYFRCRKRLFVKDTALEQ